MSRGLSIVVPVYNEGENIRGLIDGLAKALRKVPFTLYIVYDFDGDNTIQVVRSIRDGYRFRIVLMKNRYGKGVLNAVKTGLYNTPGGAVLVTMADLSDDARDIPRMYGLCMSGYDVVCGSRYMKGGGIKGGSFFKKLMSRSIGITMHYLNGIPTHDVTNNFKMYSRRLIRRIKIESEAGFELGMEITVKAYAMGFRIAEVPTVWRDRAAGKSRFRLMKWAPEYFKWYVYGLTHRPGNPRNSHA